ncbi:MAG: hypothetical protein QG574_1342 [Cyanobacteriota bacterium erpe_2018_sw_21hr_WHONDRS-SW48-000092_B_bin.40]|nr:hypothetical protein [Cyanobacteriota bacterium erpe_2018_sw_21hr_WHONDRS-SW48-000092_B_bin.40]
MLINRRVLKGTLSQHIFLDVAILWAKLLKTNTLELCSLEN